MHHSILRLILSGLAFFLFTNTFWAQNYNLQGRILDASSKNPLPGTSIAIEGTSLGEVSDIDGRFVITGISLEKIVVNISYIGYETQRVNIDFNQDKSPNLNITLKSSSVELNEVVVSGIMEGQIKAFIEQKQAESIKNIISAEQIKTFPDLNAAEVMQRIPGITLQRDQGEGRFVQLRGTPPELTNFNVNGEQIPSPQGDVRYVGMDIIPADQIETIEVTKVMTPDMDADGIGGSVNIKTKEALGEKPTIGATLAGGYNNLRGTPIYNVQFSYGQRYNKLGFQINSSYFQNNQGADNIEFKYAKGPFFGSQDAGIDNYFVQYREVQLRHYDITRTRN